MKTLTRNERSKGHKKRRGLGRTIIVKANKATSGGRFLEHLCVRHDQPTFSKTQCAAPKGCFDNSISTRRLFCCRGCGFHTSGHNACLTSTARRDNSGEPRNRTGSGHKGWTARDQRESEILTAPLEKLSNGHE